MLPPAMRASFRWILGLAALLYAVGAALLAADGLTDRVAAADLAVIPGNRIEPDGHPSARLAARLDRAAELYRAGLARELFVSGGTGVEGFDEARVMRDYLVAHGVPAAAIHEDPDGRDTWATAQHAAALMRERKLTSAIAVSQYFHVPRTRLALERCGVATVYGAHAHYFDVRDAWSLAREVPAWVWYDVRHVP